MKVLFLLDTLEVGGAEKSLLEILAHFQHIQPIMCHIYPGDALRPAYEQAGIQTISLNIAGKYAFPAAVAAVAKVVQQYEIDLIHTALFRADVVGRLVGRKLKIPVISSFVNEAYAPIRRRALSTAAKLKLRAVQLLDAFTAKWAWHFTANSMAIKVANAHALHLPLNKISIIYRGRDPQPFLAVNRQQIEETKTTLGLTAGDKILLNVGRLLYRKGQGDLIQAMPQVVQAYPTAKLLIAGKGPFETELATLINNLNVGNAVHLLGHRADIPILLSMTDIFIFPSHYEGYPGALLEAMFAGCPIIASDIPVHREAIEPGSNGQLVEVQNANAIAQSVLAALQDPWVGKTMGQRAQAVANERFHIKTISSQHEQLYTQLFTRWQGSI